MIDERGTRSTRGRQPKVTRGGTKGKTLVKRNIKKPEEGRSKNMAGERENDLGRKAQKNEKYQSLVKGGDRILIEGQKFPHTRGGQPAAGPIGSNGGEQGELLKTGSQKPEFLREMQKKKKKKKK